MRPRRRAPEPARPVVQQARINEGIRASQVRLVDEDGSQIGIKGRDEARESLTTKVLPVQQNEFVCKNCFLVKHRSQLHGESGGQPVCRECS